VLPGAEDQRPFGVDQGVDRLMGAESLPQAVGFNCGLLITQVPSCFAAAADPVATATTQH
jgi:hypothetical protein